ncbi:MAG: hypothetical protein IJR41_04895 [Atopobiaceae bacterium]|nr:hypothetical protein [Atopobiaceae bacterium]
MIDLHGNRWGETYTYRRVDWGTWMEGADLGSVTDGSVELSAFTDLKATCSFTFIGEAPEQDSLIRIYYSFTDDDGEQAEFCLGTFIVVYADVTYTANYELGECTGLVAKGSADGCSMLKVPSDRVYGMPFTVTAGTNPVAKAAELVRGLGVNVEVGGDVRYVLENDHTFEPDDSYLTIANWCLAAAGFSALTVDAYGTLHADPYVAPEDRPLAASFANDDDSIMYPEVSVENDWQSTPNVVRAYYEDEACALCAVSKNLSGSLASLANRGGRELTRYESVAELEGGTTSEKLASLEAIAERVLTDNSSDIERVTLSHPYIPLNPSDPVRIDYADRTWQGSVQNIGIALVPSTKCDTQTRRISTSSMQVETTGEIVWEVT